MATITDEMKRENPALAQEDDLAQRLPAIFANRFWVRSSPAMFRIAFAEGFEGKNYQYRSAVMVPASDAKALGQLLLRMSDQYEAEAAALAQTVKNGP